MRLVTTFQGAGVLHGDLTPECAAVVSAVLDALSAPAGAEDDRTRDQRYHDALPEAMRRLVAAGLLPERAGQPVKVWAYISLADLLRLDGNSALQEQWTAQVRAQWAAHRAAASETGGDGGAWLDGDAAEGDRVRRGDGPDRHRRRQRGRAGGPGPAVRRARQAPPRRRFRAAAGGGTAAAPGATTAAWRPAARPGPKPSSGPSSAGRRPPVRPGRPRLVPAPPPARRPAGRAEPAAGHRVFRDRPGRDPQRGDAARPALPVGGPVRPARRGVPGAPHQAQGQRRPDSSRAASFCAGSTTRWSSTAGAGPWS